MHVLVSSVSGNFQSQGFNEEFLEVNKYGSHNFLKFTIHFIGSRSQLFLFFDLKHLSYLEC